MSATAYARSVIPDSVNLERDDFYPTLRGGDQMMAGGGGMIAFAWYVWDRSHVGPPTLGWLP